MYNLYQLNYFNFNIEINRIKCELMNLVTLKDIAREAGVSLSTVSYVINGDQRIGEETTRKVMDVVDKLGYAQSAAARAQKQKKSNVVGAFLHTMHGPFYSDLLFYMQQVFECNGYEMIVCMGDNIKFDKYLDGALILNPSISDDKIFKLCSRKFPTITLDRELSVEGLKSVVIDNFDGEYQITRQLIESGCKKLCFIGGDPKSYDSNMRWEGFKKAVEDSSLDINSMLYMRGNFTEASGRDMANFILCNNVDLEAVVCANDEMAVGLIRELGAANVSIPQDIKVVGFDDIVLAQYTNPMLTTVRVDREKWGAVAAYTLIHMMSGKAAESDHIKIPVQLIHRQSA
jgi:LacI family transcriptional regulator